MKKHFNATACLRTKRTLPHFSPTAAFWAWGGGVSDKLSGGEQK